MEHFENNSKYEQSESLNCLKVSKIKISWEKYDDSVRGILACHSAVWQKHKPGNENSEHIKM